MNASGAGQVVARRYGRKPGRRFASRRRPRALVVHHDAETREVSFNDRLRAFAQYRSFKPRACAPYRARTKGKDERGVGCVTHNAIAGHGFAGWADLEAAIVEPYGICSLIETCRLNEVDPMPVCATCWRP